MKKVHLICNAHIDPIWQWDWQEGASAALSTFRSAVELADEYDYIFCHNEVTLYRFVQEYAPELFERIRELVKAGKWHIMGGWYLQPDCNMPSGESFTRQILKGKQYFTEHFGVYPTTAINFDPFGHTKGLVQIIQKCGQDSYIFMRPSPSQLPLPSDQFIWKGFAGSQIKAVRASAYNTPLGKSAETIERRANNQEDGINCILWGVGNHGGGPSRKDLSDIRELMKKGDVEYVHSTPERFFAEIQPQAAFDRSLHISMPGCYTSMARVKRAHIKLENELYQAEKLCSAASLAKAMLYPAETLGSVTEDLLNAEFHDTLPGTCIESGEENALNYLKHGLLDAERLKTKAFFAMMNGQERAKEREYPIFIYNSQPYDMIENVECEFMLADQNYDENCVSHFRVYDGLGNAVRFQVIKEESNLNMDWRKRLLIEAPLKAFSLNRFSVYVDYAPPETDKRREEFVFDNGRKYVEIDPDTGLLKHYRINGVEFVNDGFSLVMCNDNADPWAMSASQLKGVGSNEIPFVLEKEPQGPFRGLSSVQVVENGDLCLAIEAFFVRENTRARILYKIYKNNDDIDIQVTLFMNEADRMVKLRVPTALTGFLVGQTAFGEDKLFTDGRENVSHRYVAVRNGNQSFAILNDCIYGSSYSNGNLYLNLVRGVTYCAHPISNRQLIPSDRYVKKVDQGQHDFHFRFTVANHGEVGALAQQFNQKPYALHAFPLEMEKTAPKSCQVLLNNRAITLEAMKRADRGEEYLLHLLNNAETKQQAVLTIGDAKITLSFEEYEIKTAVLRDGQLYENKNLML